MNIISMCLTKCVYVYRIMCWGLLMFCNAEALLDEQQPCDDYRELLEPTLISLSSIPQSGINFKALKAYHRV